MSRQSHVRRKGFKTNTRVSNLGFTEFYWQEYPQHLRICNDKDHIGKQVWKAGDQPGIVTILEEVYLPGEDMYPEGGYRIRNKQGEHMSTYLDQCILHPDQNKIEKPRKKRKLRKAKKQ